MAVTPADAPAREVWSIRVEGTVQGVGFRPFVHRVATGLGLDGVVRNVGGDVQIEVAGPPAALAALARALREQPPPNAVVTRVSVTPDGGESAAIGAGTGFTVASSSRV